MQILYWLKLSRRLESNQRPTDYKSVALPTELLRRFKNFSYLQKQGYFQSPFFRNANVSEFD
jgi:hypothetical protein